MKSYQFLTSEGRGGTMLCDDETLEDAVAELRQRFKKVVRVQLGNQVWHADVADHPVSETASADDGRAADQQHQGSK